MRHIIWIEQNRFAVAYLHSDKINDIIKIWNLQNVMSKYDEKDWKPIVKPKSMFSYPAVSFYPNYLKFGKLDVIVIPVQ